MTLQDLARHPHEYACYTTLCRILSGAYPFPSTPSDAQEGLACLETLKLPFEGSDAFLKLVFETLLQQLTPEWDTTWGSLPTGKLTPTLDCCGTGGSGFAGRFNVSTTVAVLLASMGTPIIKFGNKAVSAKASTLGSFDFLDVLGLSLSPEVDLITQHRLFQQTNLWFLFAPRVYPTLGALQAWRKAYGHPTLFNVLGPMLNPANPTYHWHGVMHPSTQALMQRLTRLASPFQTPLTRHGAWAWHTTERGFNHTPHINSGSGYLDEASQEGTLLSMAQGNTPLASTEGLHQWHQWVSTFHPLTQAKKAYPVVLPSLSTTQEKLETFHACLKAHASPTYTGWQHTVWLNVVGCLWHSGKVGSLEEGWDTLSNHLAQGHAWQWYQEVLCQAYQATYP
ncbi:MAG: anthranilate phosphoribosyltransferase [Vampirovibrionales bacterium]